MNKIFFLFLCFIAAVNNANADFSGQFAIENWLQTINGGNIVTNNLNQTVTLTGSDGSTFAEEKNQDFTITLIADSDISFSWQYDTNDNGGPFWDQFGYLLNGTFYSLTQTGPKATNSQQGSYSITLFANDNFGFRLNSNDSLEGAATTTVTNFTAPIPLPAAVWLFGTGLFGILWRAKRRSE